MLARALTEYIINALWQIPLLAGGAWLWLRMAKPGPQAQHRIWLAILALCVLFPLRGLDHANAITPQLAETVVDTQAPAAHEEQPFQPMPRFGWNPQFLLKTHTVRLNPTVAHWLVRLYLATVAFTLFRLTRAWSASRRLVEGAQVTSQHNMALAYYSQRFRVRAPQVRESEEVSSPMIVGAVSPVLLLPEGFFRRTEDEVRAALCHELAHIQRRDYLMNLLCQVAALPVAWHPVVSEVQQSIRTTREMVCDAMAAQEMKSQLGYAKCLLALAHSMLGNSPLAEQRQFLGLFTNNTLEKRVMRLMDTTKMTMQARIARATSGAVVMAATGTLAAMFHVTPTMAELRADAQQPAMQAAPAPQPVPAPSPALSPIKRVHKKRLVRHKPFNQIAGPSQEQIQRDPSDAIVELETPEFRQHIQEEAHRRMAIVLDSREFKQQMKEVQRQMANIRVTIDGPEFKHRIREAERQVAGMRVTIDTPEFRQQMEDVQRQVDKAMANVRIWGPCLQGQKTPSK
jgi:beta-lactamase regulating signal transducer with metallopeptidase domain